MPMTITEKILASHSGKTAVKEGEFVEAQVDLAFANDITAPLAIKKFEEWGGGQVFDVNKVAFVLDHFTPHKDVVTADQCRLVREFSQCQSIRNYFEAGASGIEHVLLPEKGLILPGDLVIGADSHTCTGGALAAFASGVGSTDLAAVMITGKIWLRIPSTIRLIYHGELPPWTSAKDLILYTIGDIGVDGASYRSMEFTGEVLSRLSMAGRLTMCNMAVEAGAKNAIVEPDGITLDYIKGRGERDFSLYYSDAEAEYLETRDYNVGKIEPQVALPSLPANVKGISEVEPIAIDQVVIGSCTNGHLEDLRVAAEILKGRKVHSRVRLIIIPATPFVYLEALKKGLLQVFLEAGALVSPPTCGPCIGGHMGVLGEGEVAVATTNRNFRGRMGHPESKVYLAGPAIAAASSITGRIAGPDEIK